jgi:VPDSG-CTERM motif
MKLTPLVVVLLCLLALCSAANAIYVYQLPTDISGSLDMPKNGTGGGGGNANSNNQASNFFRLEHVVAGNFLGFQGLPTPILTDAKNLQSNVLGAGGLVGYDYAVLHYGSGKGGTPGGGVAFYYLDGASDYAFPSVGSGPNGFGGFSSLTLFKGDDIPRSVPDAGSSLTLLGAALGLIALFRRKFGL